MATKRKGTKGPRRIRPIPVSTCGYKIERGAKAGDIMGPNECAFTTYALEPGPAIALSEPTVAFWGPGQKIQDKFGAATVTYYFVGGIVFRNC